MPIQNTPFATVDAPIFHEGHGDGHDDGPITTPVVGDPNGAIVPETVDAPSDITTPYSISVGDTFQGTINNTDLDYIAIDLVAGEFYQVAVSGDDPRLWVLDSNGDAFEYNDDIDYNGGNFDSFLTFEATYSGTYYFAVNGYNAVASSYSLSVDTFTPIADGSVQDMADYLTSGYWTDNGGTSRSFDTSVSNVITVNITSLSAAGQQLARWAFEAWELVADIDFQEVAGAANISFQNTDAGAWSNSSVSGGTILSSTVNVSTDWLTQFGTTLNSYSFQTYIHEIGHALGLGHQGGYNGSAEYGTDENFGNDSWQMSIMSYFDQVDSLGTDASWANIMSAMMVDIVAIQDLYGAAGAGSATAGNTVWGMNSNLGGYLGDFFNGVITVNSAVAMTIYDLNGTDLMDFRSYTDDSRIDMRAGQFSDVGGLIGNLGIAVGTVIENVYTGVGNDHVTGNDVANLIKTNEGDDWTNAGGGSDTVWGGFGHDTIYGGDGGDLLGGSNGADLLFGEKGFDTMSGGYGNDTLSGGTGADNLSGGGGNDVLKGGNGSDSLFGGLGDDSVSGGFGDDSLYGAQGEDTLNGGGGQDRLFGGDDSDVLRGGNGEDTLHGDIGGDTLNGGDGNDLLDGGNGWDFLNGGANNDTLLGGYGSDTLIGGSGDDSLVGGGGNDALNFGAGNDVGDGGLGADTFVFSTGVGSSNMVNNFSSTEGDMLSLDDALWGGAVLSAADVLNTYGADSAGNYVLTFGTDVITITGWAAQFDASMIDII
ncbi:M10 family metallopeptidase [Shimia sagamensis]|uniref:Serralysin n=1 Tax=Shimia sagamensis TaxID=1566352 RepID=A0ABY1NBW0_9RHOB|nr:M10 family metallopeptidase [Shimia sagamensis]SMP05991.1 serralysin [Shimia sagamensis]